MIDEGLEKTVRWYLNNKAWWMPLLTRQELEKGLVKKHDISFGKTGQLARELQKFKGIVALGREQVDLADTAACGEVILRYNPSAVINAAAYTSVDKAEEEEDLAT